jgi:hypothetical protein
MDQLHENAQNLANLLACMALKQMAAKADTSPETILAVIESDPNGNTSRYFRSLMETGIQAAQDSGLINKLAA